MQATIPKGSGFKGYLPNSQDMSRYGLVPFQRVQITLDTDRTTGEFFSAFEGEGIYVEAADYPCLISLVQQGAPTRQISVAARDGLILRGPFKGLSVSHPNLTPTGFQRMVLSLLLLRTGDAITNEYNAPRTRLPLSWRSINNTALIQTWGLHVPQGVRQLDYLQVQMASAAAGVIDATAQPMWGAGVSIVAPSTIVQQAPDTGAAIAYNINPVTKVKYADAQLVAAGPPARSVFTWNTPMVLPANTFEIIVSIVGSGGLTQIDRSDGAFS